MNQNLYTVLTCKRDDSSQKWEAITDAPCDMDRALVKLQYYRKNWGSIRKYKVSRV